MTTTHPGTTAADTAMAGFETTTSRWGRITMIIGLILSVSGPAYLLLFADLGVEFGQVLLAFTAVATVFGIFWVLEPLTYFPVLGPAAMYQAFMIGNISNKLLPAAVVAQSSIDVRAGTRKGDLAAVMAICGAAMVHLTSLLIFVGFLGTWLISLIPPDAIQVVRTYILPAVMGAVVVQTIATIKQLRPTLIAIITSAILVFAVVGYVAPGLDFYVTAIAVFVTVALSWVLRERDATYDQEG